MSASLLALAKLATHELAFVAAAKALGFLSLGDIERFLFKAYGKAIRKVPAANRPRGVMFFLEPPAVDGSLPKESDLVQKIHHIQSTVKSQVHYLRLDLAAGSTPAYNLTTEDRKVMTGNAWPQGVAQMLSRKEKKCVVWADGVSAFVYIDGDIYRESADVVAELQACAPRGAALLPWDDASLAFEYASHELNDTSRAGIWSIPEKYLLCPKPELLMSKGLGKFLRTRMAGYWYHADESYIENSGRADILLGHANGEVYLIETKWTGRALSSSKEHQAEKAILRALVAKDRKWFTVFDDSTFDSGIQQLKVYFANRGYDKAFLVVFDCCQPMRGRQHEFRAISAADVAPYSVASFKAVRACVDPRKASKSSKAKVS